MTRELLVSAGTGPEEARRFVALLAAWLEAECARRGLEVAQVLASGPEGAPRSVCLRVHGEASLADLLGTHALVARSARRGKRARKRWFVGVTLTAAHTAPPVALDPREVLITACRAGGPGGQHVNTCASAVRAAHGPSGLSVRVASERSQHANRRLALERLGEALAARAQQQRDDRRDRRWRQHHQLERGRPTRTWQTDARGELQS
ncbi:MAG: peptide chain release factor-like protein [Alphaproteobacteria bacterium]|nr:peptide chain release factor-like protein [Alphaproteobacteria bacterium]MCB9796915.1 peptide chain release factor-like protein [Alphaproteobacteria bacterium]